MGKTLSPLYVHPHSGARHISLDGSWELAHSPLPSGECRLADLPADGWIPVTVPGMVQWQLHEAGVLPHPYRGTNTREHLWIEGRAWWYRRTFNLERDFSREHIILVFDGLDYHAKVWLNGVELGRHEGMFGGPDFDVTRVVRETGNELVVCLIPAGRDRGKPPRNCGTLVKAETYSRWVNNEDLMTVGIWQSVRLEVLAACSLERPHLTTVFASSNAAEVAVEVEVLAGEKMPQLGWFRRNGRDVPVWDPGNLPMQEPRDLTVRATFVAPDGSQVVEEQPVILKRHRQWVTMHIAIPNPKLWWPNGLGEPDLYQVTLELLERSDVVDSIQMHYGLRTVQVSRSSAPRSQDRWGDWQFKVNGRDLFVKGVNWMPIDLLHLDSRKYRWLLTLAKQAGVQMVRVWGGGLIETDAFYDVCDELGILVWQDFPINYGWVCDQLPLDVWEEQVVRNVIRLRNRPSLAVWCGGNEFNPYDPRNAAVVGIMERSVRDFDPVRPFYRSCPDIGDVHPYPDFDSTCYYDVYGEVPAITEWGGHAIPAVESLSEFLPPEELERSFAALVDFDTASFTASHPTLVHHWGEFDATRIPRAIKRASAYYDLKCCTVEQFIEAFQLGAAETYGTVAGVFRGNYPVTTATMPWVFHRPWPSVAMQIVDHSGRPTIGYYFLKRAYEPAHVAMRLPHELLVPSEELRIGLRPSFDASADDRVFHVNCRVMTDDFTVHRTEEREVLLPAHSVVADEIDLTLDVPNVTESSYCLIVSDLKDEHGSLLSRTVCWPRIEADLPAQRVAELRQAQDVHDNTLAGPWLYPRVTRWYTQLEVECVGACPQPDTIGLESAHLVRLRVRNCGDHPAFFTRLSVLPATLRWVASDNYFWMDPGESRELDVLLVSSCGIGSFEHTLSDLRRVTFQVDAWNAPDVSAAMDLGYIQGSEEQCNA